MTLRSFIAIFAIGACCATVRISEKAQESEVNASSEATVNVAAASAGLSQHYAGFAKRNISPCTATLDYKGICKSDYINVRSEDLATTGGNAQKIVSVHSDIEVRAIAVGDETGKRILLLSLDTLLVDKRFTDFVRNAIIAQYPQMSPSDIVVNATHTHNAPALVDLTPSIAGIATEWVPSQNYIAQVQLRTVQAAIEALSGLQPVQIELKRSVSRIATYRRNDSKTFATNPTKRPTPQPLDVVSFRRADGSILGAVVTTSCHPVTMFAGPAASGSLSADFPSAMRVSLESAIAASQPNWPAPTTVFVQGFAGDMNPLDNYLVTDPFYSAADTGAVLADEVRMALAKDGPVLSGALISSSTTKNLMLSPAGSPWPHNGNVTYPITVQTVRIGEDKTLDSSWTLLALSGEVVSEQFSNVRSHYADTRNLTAIGYSNEVDGYVPTERMIAEDAPVCGFSPVGYEGCRSFDLRHIAVGKWRDGDFFANKSGLTERFGDPARNPDLWTTGVLSKVNGASVHSGLVSVSEPAGRLRIAPASVSWLAYNGYVSTSTFDFAGKQFGARIVQTPSAATTAELLLSVGSDGGNLYRYDIQSGQLRADVLVQGSPAYILLGTYSSTAHRYLRIRHDAVNDRMLWEASANGLAWSILLTLPRSGYFRLDSARIEIVAGTYTYVPSPGVALVDDVIVGEAYSPAQSQGFTETFSTGGLPNKRWTESVLSTVNGASVSNTFVRVNTGGSELAIQPWLALGGFVYNGLSTSDAYNFLGRQAIFEIKRTLNAATSAEMLGSVTANGGNQYRFQIQGGKLRADVVIGGRQSYVSLGNFNQTSHRYLRLRHDATTDRVHWESSSDRVNWTSMLSQASGFDLSNVQFDMIAGTYVPEANAGVAAFGSFEFR